eukprot:722019-Pyramimonas_sp.AAC.1
MMITCFHMRSELKVEGSREYLGAGVLPRDRTHISCFTRAAEMVGSLLALRGEREDRVVERGRSNT